ncbi:hypothetical protein CPB83DRAFT_845104 [Crepidotus variabilis]|uniref:NADH dehydrogenase [ubiquinone] 1 beta subcomplex subunit 4 n=1 Tax=Crepidotus variabilis TaxID=179855 RepID=A0A9P6JUV9_9AGAR|nr:hypothetical protein CPB83DRAFT_845104 [Crepidotus variabilis]
MGHGAVKIDPAIERFNTMRESAYLNFKWTPRTVRTAMLGFVAAPAIVYYLADNYYLHWDFVAKRKGQPLASAPPQPTEA